MRHQQLSFALVLLVICSSVNAQVLDWATPLGTAQQEIAYDVAVDPEGSVITVGTFTVAVDLDPGPGVFTVTPKWSLARTGAGVSRTGPHPVSRRC